MDNGCYYWVITEDYCDDPHEDISLVGTRGGSSIVLTPEQIAKHPDAIAFRMRDDLGQILFQGYYLGDPRDEEAMAEPLELFGQHHGQCSQISYLGLDGRWEVLI
ncbi:MAG: hypothetical protein ACTHOC_12755 [Luteimonas sp.]